MRVSNPMIRVAALAAVCFAGVAQGAPTENACANRDARDEALLFAADFAPRDAEKPKVVAANDVAAATPAVAASTQAVDSAEKPRLFAIAAEAGLTETGGVTTVAVSPFAWIAAIDPEVRTEQWKYQQHERARRFGGKVSFGGKGEAYDRDDDGVVDEALEAKNETDIVNYELSWRFFGSTDRRDRSNVDEYVRMARDAFPDRVDGASALTQAEQEALLDVSRIRIAIISARNLDVDSNAGDCEILHRELASSAAYRAGATNLAKATQTAQEKLDALGRAWRRYVDGRLVMSLVATGTEREPEFGGDKLALGLRANHGFGQSGGAMGYALDFIKNELPSGADELEGFKLGVEYKQLLPGLADALGWQDPTFSFGVAAEKYSDVPADAHDTIAVASAKLSIGAGDNIRIPISIKWANRTDLVADEDDVIAHIGISYDFDAFKGKD